MDDDLHKPWHAKSAEDVLKKLQTSEEGLSDAEAEKRLQKDGCNVLCQKKQKSILEMLKEQLTDVMVIILIAAALLSMLLNEWTEAIVILIIVALDAAVSIIQVKSG